MNDQAIEQEIRAKGKTAPRVTPADIEANIASEHYFTAAEGAYEGLESVYHEGAAKFPPPPSLALLTFCVLVLRNGFTVTGESACASPENFDAEIGRNIARQNAVQKIWPLMGYQLRDELHRKATNEQQWMQAHADMVRESGWTPGDGAGQQAASTLQPHQQRVVDEHADLSSKIVKLEAFVGTEMFKSLSEDEQERLRAQLVPMEGYRRILAMRIAAFAPA
jgi:hypothetical protein